MVAVIGDIHGCFYTLAELHKKIGKKYPGIEIFSVGDLVDRGNNSFEVMKFVIDENIKFTPGNHDYMFLHFYREPGSVFARSWNLNGNETTLLSYEKREERMQEHLDLIAKAPLYYNHSDCFISHAGISSRYLSVLPDGFRRNLDILEGYIKRDRLNDSGILWTRDVLLNLGKLQVVGHTKQFDLNYDEDSDSVYIDTGACVGNKLSAVIVENSDIIDVMEENTHLNDII